MYLGLSVNPILSVAPILARDVLKRDKKILIAKQAGQARAAVSSAKQVIPFRAK
jgi:hypothetical protein